MPTSPFTYTQLHSYLLGVAEEIRSRCSAANIGRMDLVIEIEGRTEGRAGLTLAYKLGEYSADVRGAALAPVVEEFLRRHGWQQDNDPKMLPFSGVTNPR